MKAHALRERVERELHARPFISLASPARLWHVALVHEADAPDADRDHLDALCRTLGATAPEPGQNHFFAEVGALSLKWERHTEFSTWTFWQHGPAGAPFSGALAPLLGDPGSAELPGELLVAVRMEIVDRSAGADVAPLLAGAFDASSLCGAALGGGATEVWTDFRSDADGFVRVLVRDGAGDARELGRRVQRVLEVETYRSMALLGLPLAQRTAGELAVAERRLADVTERLEILADLAEEKALLAELMKLSAAAEERAAATAYRFGASRAYFDIVRARLARLAEQPLGSLPTIGGFMDRRLGPAMRTCEAALGRQEALTARITRAANLLRTRVDLALEAQNRDLLASMERRARLQLRLQQTVEGLSVAAITYYVVGLVAYLAKAAKAAGAPLDPEVAAGAAVPLVALLIWHGVRRLRRRIERDEDAPR